MKKKFKLIIKNGLIGGLVYASFMAVFDVLDKEDFNIWKFMFNLFFFGLVISYSIRSNKKESSTKQDSSPKQ